MTSPETTNTDVSLETLTEFSVFRRLSRETLEQLQSALTLTHVRGGETLFEQGDKGDCLYVIVFGRLRVSIRDEAGERLIREMGRGEVVGEMAILTGEPRSATVRAVRDTELLRLSKAGFEQAVVKNPGAMLDISRLIVHRLQTPDPLPGQGRMSAIALLPANGDTPADDLAEKLCAELVGRGHKIRRLDADAVDEYLDQTAAEHDTGYIEREVPRWLHEQELDHDLLVYVADSKPSDWTRLCLRQADLVLVVGRGCQACDVSDGLQQMLARRKDDASCTTELVLLYDRQREKPSQTANWLATLRCRGHHHVDPNFKDDISHLARMITREAIGLVLGGGGARGFAHIGVLRAMEEANMPIDLIGGTSMGSIVAAQCAAGWSWEQVRDNCRRAFIAGGSLDDYTVPIMALLRGRRYKRMLTKLFGDLRIEDFPRPFYCCSTNLTRSIGIVHTEGLAHQWVGASIAVPGLGPPVFHEREVLVDGGVVNNLPADVMLERGRGPVIAVSVTPDTELPLDDDYPDMISPWKVLFSRLNPFGKTLNVPGIGSILMQTAWISQATAGAKIKRQVDVFIEPPVSQFRLRDWHALDELIEIGYRDAQEKLATWKEQSSQR